MSERAYCETEDSASDMVTTFEQQMTFEGRKKGKKKKAQLAPADEVPADEAEMVDEEAERLVHDYGSLLGRLQDLIRPDGEEKEKIKLPPPEVTKPRSKTACVVNFAAICAALGRPPEHVAAFVQAELARPNTLDENRNLRLAYATPKMMEQIVRRYIRGYVACRACRGLTTTIVRHPTSRLQFLQCAQCHSEHTIAPIERGFLALGRGERRRARAGGGAAVAASGAVAGSTAGVHTAGVVDSETETEVAEPMDAAADPIGAEEDVPMVDERQATLNIGIIGHVAHGKSSLVRALTGVKTQKHKAELERNITIRLGYANCKIYRCDHDECPPDLRLLARPSSCKHVALSVNGWSYRLARHVSFVDCPGHEALMQNMLSGAAVMDAALLLVAADEPCPAPQTAEHLSAVECLNLQHVVCLQNKVDLVSADRAEEHAEQVRHFIDGTNAASRGITPICAQRGFGLGAVCEQIAALPTQPRQVDVPVRMLLIRSFDVNRPGTGAGQLQGGVLGGGIAQGVLRKGQEVEIRPGMLARDANGRPTCTPLRTFVDSLLSENTPLDEALPGGLIGVGTRLDPCLTKEDRLKGQVLGAIGTLPPVFSELTLHPRLMKRAPAADATDGGEAAARKADKVQKLRADEPILISVGASSCVGTVRRVEANGCVRVALERPVCAAVDDVVALSRRVAEKWRLVGRGDIVGGVEIEPLPPLLGEEVPDAALLDGSPTAEGGDGPPAVGAVDVATDMTKSGGEPAPPDEVAPDDQAAADDHAAEAAPDKDARGARDGGGGGYRARSSCRMLEAALPEVDEMVVAQVTRIEEGEAVYVELLQYGHAPAMILASEATRHRKGKKTSLSKVTRVGKQEVCVVMKVDAERGFIDLSKTRVDAAEAREAEAHYQRSKQVHSIVCHVAAALQLEAEAVYALTAWPLSAKLGCHPFEAFSAASREPERILNEHLTPGLTPALRDALLEQIRKRFAPDASTKVRAGVDVRCVGRAGVRAIQAALAAAAAAGSEGLTSPIELKLVAPPMYTATCSSSDAATGIGMLTKALADASAEVAKYAGGGLAVKEAPAAVDESDADKGRARLITLLEQDEAAQAESEDLE